MGDLNDIRNILLQRENDRIAALEARLDVHKRRAAELADVLPDALERAHEAGSLAAPLAAPMADAVTRSVREQPERFAEALFPIMGPAIRKSIAEALKSFTQQINDAVEHSFTPRGLRWRVEAKRAGISFSEYVLRQTRTFEVEQLFAMETESGKLLGHQSDAFATLKDKDAVSAMFSALQSFVRESFVGDNADGLEIAEISGKTVWAVHGTRCSLAAAMAGSPPRALRRHLRDALDDIERLLKKSERDGEQVVIDTVAIEHSLESAMQSVPDEQVARTGSGWWSPAGIILALLLIGAAWLGYRFWQSYGNEKLAHRTLADMPGLVITDISFSGDAGRVTGFADPLADGIAARLSDVGLTPDRVDLNVTPYISLDPEIVANRARTAMSPPSQVSVAIAGNRIVVTGVADASWVARAQEKASVLAGAELIDFKVSAAAIVAEPIVTSAMRELQATIEQHRIMFVDGDTLSQDSEPVLASLAMQLRRLASMSEDAGTMYALTVLGSADSAGTEQINGPLRVSRATRLQERITATFPAAGAVPRTRVAQDASATVRAARVVITWPAQSVQ